jgi:hypothetical protein
MRSMNRSTQRRLVAPHRHRVGRRLAGAAGRRQRLDHRGEAGPLRLQQRAGSSEHQLQEQFAAHARTWLTGSHHRFTAALPSLVGARMVRRPPALPFSSAMGDQALGRLVKGPVGQQAAERPHPADVAGGRQPQGPS